MKKIDYPLQNNLGTLSQKTGLNTLPFLVLIRRRVKTTSNIKVFYTPLRVQTLGSPLDMSLELFRSKDRLPPDVVKLKGLA